VTSEKAIRMPTTDPKREVRDIVETPPRENGPRRVVRAALVTDMARFVEGLKTEQLIRSEHGLFEGDWELLIEDTDLIAEVEIAVAQRKANGTYFKEAAANELADAPKLLGEILKDPLVPARSRIDASKELRMGAAGYRDDDRPGGGTPTVIINLGNRTLNYPKAIVPQQVIEGDDAVDVTDAN
jgi:hypothetical protein